MSAAESLNITCIEQLERLGLCAVDDPAERRALERAIARFPVRLNTHLLSIMHGSRAVAQQFLPTASEITDPLGQSRCFSGLLHSDLPGLERQYVDRCIVMPQPTCPAYCRFCFRKFYEHRQGRAMSYSQLDQALAYIAADQRICEVLITGGEPIVDLRRLGHLLRGLRRIEHVGPIRIACRSLITDPGRVDRSVVDLLARHQALRLGRPVEVALHCNHPDELSPATVERLALLREAGLHVYNQAVLLRGLNLQSETMLALMRALRAYGVESYHLYFAGPVQGMQQVRPTLQQALALKSALRRGAGGRMNPHLIVTTRLGKVELGVDGWVVERETDSRHVWIRTPYRLDDFRQVQPSFILPDDARLDAEGQVVVRYLDGNPSAD
jgi:lysine 2,3-aminomutase